MVRLVVILALIGTFGTNGAGAAEPAPRPNIVIIIADDLGYSDLGCYGSEIATPNIDRLAANGLRFTQFYNAGRCCPTRAALLTGLYQHQAGVGDMEDNLGRPVYQGFLNDRCVTIAEALRPHGYRTLMAGKWNVGWARGQWPVNRGFEHHFGLLRGASDYFDPRVGKRSKASEYALEDQLFTSFDEKFYVTDAFTDYAARWIDESSNQQPLFLYVAYSAPHSPLQALPEDIAKYRGKYRQGWDVLREQRRARMVESGLVDASTQLSPRDEDAAEWSKVEDPDFQDLKMAIYAAQVDRVDQGVGRIVEALERKGMLNNTLILFLSDNGGDGADESATPTPPGPKGSSHIYGRGWAQLSNTPLRGYKREMLEGGISTPLIAQWPDVIRRPGISREVGHVMDLMATCVDVAGAPYPKQHDGHAILPTEGRSLAPIFRTGQREPHEALFWEHEGHRAARQGDWKIIALNNAPWQLYDLSIDRTESHDLAAANPGKLEELAARYDAWAARCGVVPWADVKPSKKRSAL